MRAGLLYYLRAYRSEVLSEVEGFADGDDYGYNARGCVPGAESRRVSWVWKVSVLRTAGADGACAVAIHGANLVSAVAAVNRLVRRSAGESWQRRWYGADELERRERNTLMLRRFAMVSFALLQVTTTLVFVAVAVRACAAVQP
jgi:hypothetical protein